MIQFDMQRSAFRPDRDRFVEAAVFQSQVVEQPQRLTGEPAQLVMVALRLQLTDHHKWHDDLVFGEPRACPWIGQQNRRVENVSADAGCGCRALGRH